MKMLRVSWGNTASMCSRDGLRRGLAVPTGTGISLSGVGCARTLLMGKVLAQRPPGGLKEPGQDSSPVPDLAHQAGIKRILPHQMTTAGPVLGEERRSDEFFDSLDHVIDIHGHIIGMGLSPDHRYLYVNSRAWPRDCVISDPMQPPPIAEEINLHVFDLKTMKEVKRALRAHRAYTPNEECFFIFLDVSKDFVASGAEDRHGYIWDRHYNICLAKLQHDNVVNSVAFSPVEQELLLTASDDTTIKVWRSPRAVRIRQARSPRPRKLLFSWLMNQKS
ncbi:hypothetical protein IHE44_0007045 [Lamprotornis superbus]|uniref:F-box/WD repeat-containing protein 5 n=1 Tax=Lamprotornis superbus TaxID=245042 RepID=A0A835NNH5_9PASS|nr:hypothetical protein IHE44_0007045 [Lamprotornis superbus]